MDDVGWSLLAIAVMLGVSLFFSMHSLALRTFSRVKLQDAFKKAGKIDPPEAFFENTEKFIVTCMMFSVILNTGVLVVFIRLMVIKEYGYIAGFVIAAVVMFLFRLTIPHSWAKYTAESTLVRTYKLLGFFAVLAYPALALHRLHDGLVRRLAGIAEATPDQEQDQKQEEILSVVEQGKMEGVVDEEELEMIENVLELSDTTAQEIMTPRTDVIAVNINDDLQTVLETITNAGHSRIPVYEENIDKIIGLVYAKDLLAEIGRKSDSFTLKDRMRSAFYVPETKPLRELLHEFQNQKLHISIVLDEYGGTAGIVTIEDILEELVGEIADEYEETPPETLKKIDETTIEVDGRMYIDDLNAEFDLNLPEEEDYDTVAGFVLAHLGCIPKTGVTFEYENVKFTIVQAEARKIGRITVQKLEQNPKQNQ